MAMEAEKVDATLRDGEKESVDAEARKLDTNTSVLTSDFSPEEQKSIVRRIDRRLITTVGFMYCVSLMDRTNLGAANIAGMKKELNLVGERYVRLSVAAPGHQSPEPRHCGRCAAVVRGAMEWHMYLRKICLQAKNGGLLMSRPTHRTS